MSAKHLVHELNEKSYIKNIRKKMIWMHWKNSKNTVKMM